MFNAILVPLDGSLQAETALPLAKAPARVFGNRLLLHRAGEQPPLVDGIIADQLMLDQPVVWSLDEAESYLKHGELAFYHAGCTDQTQAPLPITRSVTACSER